MDWPRPWSRRWQGVWLGLLCAVLAWLIARQSLLAGIENWMLDTCFVGRGTRASAARERIVIVELDDEGVRKLRKPASHLSPELADVIRYLVSRKVAAIGIDIIVPQDMGDLKDISGSDGAGAPYKLGAEILKAGIVVSASWQMKQPDGEPRMDLPLTSWQLLYRRHEGRPRPSEWAINPHLAFVNLTEDGDHFIRRQELTCKSIDPVGGRMKPWAQFALAIQAVASKGTVESDAEGRVLLSGQEIPCEADGMMKINYVGPPGSFRTAKFQHVRAAARGEAVKAPDIREGDIVLVGITAQSFQDYHATPYSNAYTRWLPGDGKVGRMGGTEVHANTLATIHDRAYIRTLPWLHLPLLLVTGGVLGWLFTRVRLAGVLLITVLHHVGWKMVAVAVFATFYVRLPVVSVLLLGLLACTGAFLLRWLDTRRTLGMLKSEGIADAVLRGHSQVGGAATKRRLTVLFADVRGFTKYAEGRDPAQVVRLLNAYFGVIVPVIERHGGTLNQFMGDGVMVLFGAPADDALHARHAVEAAREMVREVRRHQARWQAEGLRELRIGVGINTGEAVVGLVGSNRRVDYTAIGETTNAASRIEGMNKLLGTEILISSSTHAELGEAAGLLGCEPTPRSGQNKDSEIKVHVVATEQGG